MEHQPKIINPRTSTLAAFIFAMATIRVLLGANTQISPWSNFTPLAAMALFGGAYFRNYKALALPILSLWLSDIALNKLIFYGEWRLFYPGAPIVYGAFALIVLTGKSLLKRVGVANLLLANIVGVGIHWIITDIPVWLYSGVFPKTLAGYGACLVAAIPYEKNLLLSSLIFSAIMFGAYEWMSYKIPALRPKPY